MKPPTGLQPPEHSSRLTAELESGFLLLPLLFFFLSFFPIGIITITGIIPLFFSVFFSLIGIITITGITPYAASKEDGVRAASTARALQS